MEIENKIEKLIKRYSGHLKSGLKNEDKMKKEKSSKLEVQITLNKAWRIFLKDLYQVIDKPYYVSKDRDKTR